MNQEVYLDEQYEEREEEVSSAINIKMAATTVAEVTHGINMKQKSKIVNTSTAQTKEAADQTQTYTFYFQYDIVHCCSYVPLLRQPGMEESIPIRIHINEKSLPKR